MVKGNKQGGKKYKSKKKREPEDRSTVLKDDQQSYALVIDVLGNCRFRCRLDDGEKVLAILCGRLRKRRVWIKKNDLLLVSKRDYEQGKVDIILKYNQEEHRYLRDIEHELDLLLKDEKIDDFEHPDFDETCQEIEFDNSSEDDDEGNESEDLDDL